MDEYFCTNCGAILNDQLGFDPELGAWTCTECGQQLMDNDVYEGDTYEGVAWYCDGCGALLNKQSGFSDSYDSWICKECGYTTIINENTIIDGKLFKCPECGDVLNYQSGFNSYDDDWECFSCGAKLTHSYYDDDFSVVEEEEKILCPNCDADLRMQWPFSEYDSEWTCTECGTKLRKYYGDHEYSIVYDEKVSPSDNAYEEDDAVIDPSDDTYEKGSDSAHAFGKAQNKMQQIDKASLRKIRIKAFIRSGKKISVGFAVAQLIGTNYREVERKLYNQAFKNIQLISRKDIYIDSAFEDGEVESVLINGSDSFLARDMFSYDSQIIIIYHEKKEIILPFSNLGLREMNYNDVCKQLMGLGFVNIMLQPMKDLITGWLMKDGSIERVSISNKAAFKKGVAVKYDEPIVIEYHTFRKDKS